MFPNRSIASDGICASPQHHQQNPTSDHETGEAFDLTHDPAHGCDVDELFARIIARRDPRVKYLIRNKRILRSYAKPGIPAWTWSPYTGSNPHIKHGHCSILPDARHKVDLWFSPSVSKPLPQPVQEDDMAIIIADNNPNDSENGQVLALGNKLYRLRKGEDAQGLTAAGVKTAQVSRDLFDVINADAQ